MFTINEIETENQNSFLPRLYLFLAKSILSTCGRSGEGAVREAVQRYAAERGTALREGHLQAGLKANVKAYHCAPDCATDSRKREKTLCLNEEVCIKEVYTCPYADIWRRYGASDVGMWFCEELERAKFAAYTLDVGQAHLSARLTCERENNCRFSLYYRKANVTLEMGELCFSDDREKEAQSEDYSTRFLMSEGERCARLYYAIFETARSRFGSEGVCAIASGLRDAARDAADTLQTQAKHTRNSCDVRFVGSNFPLPLIAEEEPYIAVRKDAAASAVLQKHLLDPIGKALGLLNSAVRR